MPILSKYHVSMKSLNIVKFYMPTYADIIVDKINIFPGDINIHYFTYIHVCVCVKFSNVYQCC